MVFSAKGTIRITPQADVDEAYRLLAETHTAFVVAGVDYVACCGTLLGILRHGGLIPWDDDVDIAMRSSDTRTFQDKVIPQLTARGYRVVKAMFGFKVLSPHRPVDLDVFTLHPSTSNPDKLLLTERAMAVWPREWMSAHDTFPSKPAMFGPVQVRVPNSPIAYARRIWGHDYMTRMVVHPPHITSGKGLRLKEVPGWIAGNVWKLDQKNVVMPPAATPSWVR
jgi:lipopolysaccharide cholinephosphotransferase